MTKQVRRRITEQDLVDLALSRFSSEGVREYSQIGGISGRADAVVIRAITSAFRRGLVEVRPKVSPHLRDVGRALVDEFDLLGALLAEGTSDELKTYRLIGAATASLVEPGLVWPDHARIGVGSGRAVNAFVEALAQRGTSLRARDVTIASLSGNLRVQNSEGPQNMRFDADWNASVLARTFIHPVDVRLADHRLLAKSEDSAREIVTDRWTTAVLTHVVSGIGMFGPGHRMYDSADAVGSGVGEKLETLRLLCRKTLDQYGNHYSSSPIADVSNRLFVITPAAQGLPDGLITLQRKMAVAIEDLNRFLVLPPAECVRDAGTTVILAAAPRKRQAILHLLSGNGLVCRPRFLSTDLATAEWLLAQRGRE
jgi:DNA-binding transcriptional regulator LsrR (DeoR family)